MATGTAWKGIQAVIVFRAIWAPFRRRASVDFERAV
jgi:hypothetical protein